MKAMIVTQYGSPEVILPQEIKKPTPKDNEVLVKIHVTTVTAAETVFRKGKPYFARLFTGILKPKRNILGNEFAGTIETIGKKVTLFQPNDHVFGSTGPLLGTQCEYICIPETGALTLKPEQFSFEEAVTCIDGFLTSIPFLRDKGNIQPGHRVLIHGASGSVGTAAIQVARIYGAHVTGVCSAQNLKLVEQLGADKVIDYTKEDFTKNDEQYDIIFDTVGKITYSKCKQSLKKEGVFLQANFGLDILMTLLGNIFRKGQKVRIATTGLHPTLDRFSDLTLLKDWIELGKISPVMDKRFTLDQLVEAHKYVDTGRKKGNVVIKVI